MILGNFSNISPVDWLGAFHWTDLLMIFGTYEDDAGGDIPTLEVETSETMQDYLLAFIKDPSTLSSTVGWTAFNASEANGGVILEFGNITTVQTITGDYLDGGCWDSSIPFRVDG